MSKVKKLSAAHKALEYKKLLDWATSAKTGVSSRAILRAYLDLPQEDSSAPQDLADFKRCNDLLSESQHLEEWFLDGGMDNISFTWRILRMCWLDIGIKLTNATTDRTRENVYIWYTGIIKAGKVLDADYYGAKEDA